MVPVWLMQREAHIPLRCEEVKDKIETSARTLVEEKMTEARIRVRFAPQTPLVLFLPVLTVLAARFFS